MCVDVHSARNGLHRPTDRPAILNYGLILWKITHRYLVAQWNSVQEPDFARGFSFESEKAVPVRYKDRLLCYQRIDLFVDSRLVVELKSVEELHPVHVAQVVSYVRLTGSRLGLLVNFNVPLLKQGIRRIVL